MFANVWIGLRDDAQEAIRTAITAEDSEYSGPVSLRQRKFFRYMADVEAVEKLFKSPVLGGRTYTLWSLSIDLPGNLMQQVAGELEDLQTNYPSQFFILGVWHKDGRQFGTQWIDPSDRTQGTTGTPTYPIHPQLIRLMPDVWNGDDPPTYSAATELTDINVIYGQAFREFT